MGALDFSDVREMQSEGDSDIIDIMTEMGCFFINPRWKLPPRLRKDNMWLVLAKSVISPWASIEDCTVDKTRRIIKIDHTQLKERYHWFIKWFSETFQARNNLTIYSIFLNEASNSSKFIHGINLPEVVDKWEWEWRQGEEKTADQVEKKADERANEQLKEYIESMRNVLHIDEDLEIVSAKLVKHGTYTERTDRETFVKPIYKIHLHFKADWQDTTIAFGYPTKRTSHDLGDGKSAWFINGMWNDFSPKWVEEIERLFSDEEIREITAELEQRKAKWAINFFIWRAPEYITKENYKFYHRHPVRDWMSDDDALKEYHWVLKHFPATEGEEWSTQNENWEWEIRVIVELVSDAHGSELYATQDQVLPDYWKRYWDKKEKEKFNYWKNVFFQDIKKSIDNWESVLRVDLAHSFFVEWEDRMLEELIKDAVNYAGRKVYFVLETYNKYKSKIDTFRDRNNGLPYPAIKVYHKQIEDNLFELQNGDWPDNLMWDLNWLLQDLRWIFGEMAAIATYDDHSLAVVAERSGIPAKALLEMILLLWKAWFNAFLLDRDFKLLRWQICPMPWWNDETHLFPDIEELRARKEDFEDRYKESRWAQILEEINSLWDIKGIDLDPDNKTLIFFFKCGTKKIFNFLALRDTCNDGRRVETIMWEWEKKEDNQLKRFRQRKKRTLWRKPIPWEDKIVDTEWNDVELASVYDTKFWEEFYAYIKTQAWDEKKIHDNDKWKQEAYFLLNRERLIRWFLETKGLSIESAETEKNKEWISSQLIDARERFKQRVDKTLQEKVAENYKDLALAA